MPFSALIRFNLTFLRLSSQLENITIKTHLDLFNERSVLCGTYACTVQYPKTKKFKAQKSQNLESFKHSLPV